MSNDLESAVWEALKTVKFPGMSRDIVSFGFVHQVQAAAGAVVVDLQMSTHNPAAGEKVRDEVERIVRALPGVERAQVNMNVVKPPAREEAAQKAIAQDSNLIPEVRHVVAVASGKGGVGKSTVAANLAVSLAQMGHRVGLLDSDIYGPSVPTMFGINQKPRVVVNRIYPFETYGLRLISLGFILQT